MDEEREVEADVPEALRPLADLVRDAAPAADPVRARRLASAAAARCTVERSAEEHKVIRLALFVSAAAAVLAIAVGAWAVTADGGSAGADDDGVVSVARVTPADEPEAWLAADDAEAEALALDFLMAHVSAGGGR